MKILERLRSNYLFSKFDKELSLPPRIGIRYCTELFSVYYRDINPKGYEPIDYLRFAKASLINESEANTIEALSHAKRAVHLTVESLTKICGLSIVLKRENFPSKLNIFKRIDAFPTSILDSLNDKRNLIEHKYTNVSRSEVRNLVEAAELFLYFSYPLLRHFTIGLRMGLANDDRDIIWKVNILKNEIIVDEFVMTDFRETEIGRVYIATLDANLTPNYTNNPKVIRIQKNNVIEWEKYLSTFFYFSKQRLIQGQEQVKGSDKGNIGLLSHSCSFADI